MKFYRALHPFKLMSFDLDDTLYDNEPVIAQAEKMFLQSLQQQSGLFQLTREEWNHWKMKIAQQMPLLAEDVVAWRIETMKLFLNHYGKSAVEIEGIYQSVIQTFTEWRHQITVPQISIEVLNQLKKYYPLVAITNGNVEPERIGLNQFDWVVRGGKDGRAKPHFDLFEQTAQQFHIRPQDILHIGDHLITDIQGAIQANCQAGWINVSGQSLKDFPQCRLLPTFEIHHINQLLDLLPV